MKINDCDGQMNLFKMSSMEPDKENGDLAQEVQLNTEFEDFFSVGKKIKKAKKDAKDNHIDEKPVGLSEKSPVVKKVPEEDAASEEEEMVVETKKLEPRTPGSLHAVMQKSFYSAAGKTATVAYVDYNMIYTQDFKGKATLVQYPDSKQAVNDYLKQLSELRGMGDAMEVKEHPKFKKVTAVNFEEMN